MLIDHYSLAIAICRLITYRQRFARAAPAPRFKESLSHARGAGAPEGCRFAAAGPNNVRQKNRGRASPVKIAMSNRNKTYIIVIVKRVKRQNVNKSLPYKTYLPKDLTQNNHGFQCSLAQIKNRYTRCQGFFAKILSKLFTDK